ncbi:class C sortase [Nesterenkonia alba]|uniref:class C sortase n=1 Tax=Nesterenkonia alba TaxID=515814 RepID=UPI0003B79253|nr:class C sortase [Nesterenkonia alba]
MRWALVISTLMVFGLCVMLYPTAAQWFTAWDQRDRVQEYSEYMQTVPGPEREAELQRARDYNQQLASGQRSIDPFAADPYIEGNEDVTLLEDSDPYWDILSGRPDGIMARIRIPSIDADVPVYHGTTDDVLTRGIGHLEGTAFPVGGAGTHAVVTGHRGLPQAELFTRLDEVDVGETFLVEVFGEVLAYEVISTEVVEPHETESLHPQPGRDLMTLVTCTPLGINSHRILVTAERTEYIPDRYEIGPSPVAFPWWALALAVALALQALYLWRTKRRNRTRTGVMPRSV